MQQRFAIALLIISGFNSPVIKLPYQGGNTNNHINQPNGVPTTFFYTSDSETEDFPSSYSYEILVLKAEDKSQTGSKLGVGFLYHF
ncbi:hypothetical protein [Dolichospermum circinale]|uniref:hypothetical protein n=1 Tax=Dolichospermum circinale TaxID=109265 RepID=UPI00232C6287|nr:hypothetical protein [Dolichospermum circinale]MDB9454777.1 hypothetical protein [Dolichospermum circinale CS-541/06]MDB9463320.1 hypothetical protein [Dolichospermum circinale CS-541/04]MDB9546728.1 hypothetical protein [Dolichospermum circinale CS-1031]